MGFAENYIFKAKPLERLVKVIRKNSQNQVLSNITNLTLIG